jgi:sulfite oxidase
MTRYGKRADLIVHEQEPFNAETGLAALVESQVTATDAFYVRGHGAVPETTPPRGDSACTARLSES